MSNEKKENRPLYINKKNIKNNKNKQKRNK